MLLFRAVLNMASPRGPMRFRGLMFSLSRSYELLFYVVLLHLGPELW